MYYPRLYGTTRWASYQSPGYSLFVLLGKSGTLNAEEVRLLMHRMDPKFPMSEIAQLMKFVDVDEDGQVSLAEFKKIFRQFEDEKSK